MTRQTRRWEQLAGISLSASSLVLHQQTVQYTHVQLKYRNFQVSQQDSASFHGREPLTSYESEQISDNSDRNLDIPTTVVFSTKSPLVSEYVRAKTKNQSDRHDPCTRFYRWRFSGKIDRKNEISETLMILPDLVYAGIYMHVKLRLEDL